MEDMLLDIVSAELKAGRKSAMAIITMIEGSSPRGEGSMMVIKGSGETEGTIGGGAIERETIKHALECIEDGESRNYDFKLTEEEKSLDMICGGRAQVFIKVFVPDNRLLIAGGGHVALKLYEIAQIMGFKTAIFEDRQEFCSRERFPKAHELVLGDIAENLRSYPVDENCYAVVVTRGHSHDEQALEALLGRNAAYIGMIGSRRKTAMVFDKLIKKGILESELEKVYAPIGIDTGGETPEEIALGIMAEIVAVKHDAKIRHMKDSRPAISKEPI
ncbi:putative xanthine dehydrogenase accessory factor (plasmid) [Peptoclostridium acidaminophilum DSM 3953]|uniref:Putative xanthine dehydrogenase accessory factor n=1 Tax=Peptoclostridium acidaminophilum DSM 3953 TaxID=1286171 RepID=W8TKH1_PEPAC|nr:XdhC/CoxI family protein [Peptoclostridium acidaminophilum]AHM58228.1 putative xanthine dehydrogenase accessory factor [Peptoclostridium acidaminophilum DSM 3953]